MWYLLDNYKCPFHTDPLELNNSSNLFCKICGYTLTTEEYLDNYGISFELYDVKINDKILKFKIKSSSKNIFVTCYCNDLNITKQINTYFNNYDFRLQNKDNCYIKNLKKKLTSFLNCMVFW